MNKDQVRGVEQDAGGEALERAGKLVGSKKQQVRKLSKKSFSKAHKSAIEIKQSFADISRSYP